MTDKDIEQQEQAGEKHIWTVELWVLRFIVYGAAIVLLLAWHREIEKWLFPVKPKAAVTVLHSMLKLVRRAI